MPFDTGQQGLSLLQDYLQGWTPRAAPPISRMLDSGFQVRRASGPLSIQVPRSFPQRTSLSTLVSPQGSRLGDNITNNSFFTAFGGSTTNVYVSPSATSSFQTALSSSTSGLSVVEVPDVVTNIEVTGSHLRFTKKTLRFALVLSEGDEAPTLTLHVNPSASTSNVNVIEVDEC